MRWPGWRPSDTSPDRLDREDRRRPRDRSRSRDRNRNCSCHRWRVHRTCVRNSSQCDRTEAIVATQPPQTKEAAGLTIRHPIPRWTQLNTAPNDSNTHNSMHTCRWTLRALLSQLSSMSAGVSINYPHATCLVDPRDVPRRSESDPTSISLNTSQPKHRTGLLRQDARHKSSPGLLP